MTKKISLVLPSNRSSAAAISKILLWSELNHACFELVVRDNSGSTLKKEVVGRFSSPALRYFSVPPCDAFTNAVEAAKLATGDSVFFVADDDSLSVRGLQRIHDLVNASSPDVSGVTGSYLVEGERASGIFAYGDLASEDFSERFSSYFSANAPNFLYYSAVKRQVFEAGFEFFSTLPFKFSFHDQLISLIYLAAGKFIKTEDVVYTYDMGEWETFEKSLAKDRSMYIQAGLPVEIDALHYFLMALEGGLLLESDFFQKILHGDALGVIDAWIGTQYGKFLNIDRSAGLNFDTPHGRSVKKFCDKLRSRKEFNLDELLVDFCDLLGAFDGVDAHKYFSFWSQL